MRTLEVATVFVVCITACLDDLSEPLECPAKPQISGSAATCLDLVADDLNAFDPTSYCMVKASAASCYRDAPTCDCGDECASEPACHPAPDCPAEILETYPTARCVQLAPEDIGPFQNEADQCLCGCEACITTCDGRGPVWSQLDLADENTGELLTPQGVLTIDLQRHLPDRGKAGIYVRARGLTAATGQNPSPAPPTVLGVTDDANNPFTMGSLPSLMNDRFNAELYPADGPLTWDRRSDMPTLVGLSNNIGAFSVYEIDCIVPFVVE